MRSFEHSLPMMLLRAREAAMSFFRPMLQEHGVTEQQWRVVRILQETSDLEFHQLAASAGILPPSLTGIITRMERLGYVRRRKIAEDQRRLHVVLTDEGRALFERISVHAEQIYRELEHRYGSEQMQTLMRLLRELTTLRTSAANPGRTLTDKG